MLFQKVVLQEQFIKFKNKNIPYQIIEKSLFMKISFSDILNLAKLRSKYPEEIVIIGLNHNY